MEAAQAHYALAIITRLYEVQRATKDSDADFRRSQRGEHSAPLLRGFGSFTFCREGQSRGHVTR